MISTAEVSGLPQNDYGVVTGASGAATLNNRLGTVTTESLTTAAGATFTETITNNRIKAGDVVLASVNTPGTGAPAIVQTTVTAGQVVITVQNIHASAALNNVLNISFVVFNQN